MQTRTFTYIDCWTPAVQDGGDCDEGREGAQVGAGRQRQHQVRGEKLFHFIVN